MPSKKSILFTVLISSAVVWASNNVSEIRKAIG